MESRLQSRRSNTIPTGMLIWLACTIMMEKKRYIICPSGMQVGDTVVSGPGADIIRGNNLPLLNIPVGTTIHNVELNLARADSWSAVPEQLPSWLLKKVITPRSGCHPVKCGGFISIAAPLLEWSATLIMKTFPSEKPVPIVGGGNAHLFEEL